MVTYDCSAHKADNVPDTHISGPYADLGNEKTNDSIGGAAKGESK